MASTTIQEQVSSLVSRRIAEAKVEGVSSPDVEAAALFESIGMNLLLKPRTVLYAASLARNGVLAAVTKEISQVDALIASAKDSTNQTFEIQSTASLERAKTALLQIEDLAKADPNTPTFKSFSGAIDEFLNKQLAKNVKRKGATSLTRTGKEAASDLPSGFSTLSDLHATFIDKLYALSVGVDNFVTSPMATVLGVSTAYRARQDIQDIIDSVAEDVSGEQSRDYATRLIATRAALRVLGAPPNINSPVLDSAAGKPEGYALLATSDSVPVTATSAVGPFVVGSGSLVMTVGAQSGSQTVSTLFPAGNNPAVYSTPLAFPIVVPADHHFFIHITTTPAVTSGGGWTGPDVNGFYSHATYGGGWGLDSNYNRVFRAPIGAASFASIGVLVTALNAAMGFANADAGITINLGTASVFNGNRIVVYLNPAFQTIKVASHYTYPSGSPAFFTLSAAPFFGLELGQVGQRDSISALTVSESLNFWFSTIATTSRNQDESVSVTAVETAPGTTLLLSGQVAVDLGLPSTTTSSSSNLTLLGTVFGVAQSPFNPFSLVEIGDLVEISSGSSTVSKVSDVSVTLVSALPTVVSSNIKITSALVLMWDSLSSKISASTTSVLNSKFNEGLASIDLSIAALSGDPTVGKSLAVTALLNELKALLQSVAALLSDPSTILPNGAARSEIDNANGVVTSLEERKFDRAADYFLQCRIHELFDMDFMTASYGGSMMQAASELARTDIKFPDRVRDEDTTTVVQTNRSLL